MLGGFTDKRAVKIPLNDETSVKLSSGGASTEGSVAGEARADVGGAFEPFGVNVKYLAAIAKAFGSDWLDMAIESASGPVLMRGMGSPEGEFAVLMPMRV